MQQIVGSIPGPVKVKNVLTSLDKTVSELSESYKAINYSIPPNSAISINVVSIMASLEWFH